MIQKKVCMLGAFAVGKTSLVKRFVTSMFSETYHTTIGVKIDKKVVAVDAQEVNLILWDIHGDDDFQKLRMSYLRGASGYLLVVDGARQSSLERAIALQQSVEAFCGPLPFVLAFNKADLQDEWEIPECAVSRCVDRGWAVMMTSAKTGEGVEASFAMLARSMMSAS